MLFRILDLTRIPFRVDFINSGDEPIQFWIYFAILNMLMFLNDFSLSIGVMKSFRSWSVAIRITGFWLRNTEFCDSMLSDDESSFSDRFSTLILPSRIFFFFIRTLADVTVWNPSFSSIPKSLAWLPESISAIALSEESSEFMVRAACGGRFKSTLIC